METGIEDILYLTLREANMTAGQLKNSILQMAVQGKLVPQDPNDEPASVLLERIRAEKEKLIKGGKIKKEKNPSVIFRGEDNLPYEKLLAASHMATSKNPQDFRESALEAGKLYEGFADGTVKDITDEVPFEIPESWEWCRLYNFVYLMSGSQYSESECGCLYVKVADMNLPENENEIVTSSHFTKDSENGDIPINSIVFPKRGGAIATNKRRNVISKRICIDSNTMSMTVIDDKCFDYLSCWFMTIDLGKLQTGTSVPQINNKDLEPLLIPVPPIDEQRRIVDALSLIEPYITNYKSVENKLSMLNSLFPDLLKKSILQQAVMGKLVPQDPDDEPASVLLERIRTEKAAFIKAGKLKKDKHESIIYRRDNSHYEKRDGQEVCIDDEIPFEIPNTWEWTRASSIGSMVRGKGIKRTETVPKGVPCVRYGEIYTSYNVSFSDTISFIDESIDKNCLHFSTGDIIFTLTGENKEDIAKGVAYLGNEKVAAGGDLAYWTAHGMNPLYLVYYMASPYCIERKRRTATGDIIVHISTDKVGSFLVPVPPLKEQNRVVEAIGRAFSMVSAL